MSMRIVEDVILAMSIKAQLDCYRYFVEKTFMTKSHIKEQWFIFIKGINIVVEEK
jgi:hypothetical protein